MRKVLKGIEPLSFTNWKAKAERENRKPTYKSLTRSAPQKKKEVHESLLREQAYLCCYCGDEISEQTSHIEHFRPKSDYTPLELDYNNLHASCLRDVGELQQREPDYLLHCGHKKGNLFDETRHISPQDENCESRFQYTLNGEIKPTDADDDAASKMIEILALDTLRLNNRREETMLGIFNDDFLLTASKEELQIIAQRARGQQTRFCHVIARYAEQLLTP
ncbi:retron system putative HNH endonuclease [Pseudomonas lijiangensis]|uniref:retron system putative HNH endonuclease n=1 Tax=Pseudomonas TaxID=286 RepID=UPI000BA3B8B9|nr:MULTISPECIES: retron system putative HNH endonuclease [Pseudomonas]GFM76518.1 hypothetical protein PSCICM_23370 [Pseudomonas cichorii]